MSPWGKLIGGTVGLVAGGPLGAVIGVVFGHSLDSSLGALLSGAERARSEREYFEALFGLCGALARCDGRVSEAEVAAMEDLLRRLRFGAEERRRAIGCFNEGKRPGFAVDAAIGKLAGAARAAGELRGLALRMLLDLALADGRLKPAGRAFLERVARGLGIGAAALGELLARRGVDGGRADPYAVLGIGPEAGPREIKQAYRRMMARHHPDKLAASGVPREMLDVAGERTREIRAAYEQLRQERGFS